jgi:hypothetical protein
MTVNDFDLTEAIRILGIANTPLFLVRKLQADPVVREISEVCSSEDILAALRNSTGNEPASAEEEVLPYVLLVALWFKPEISGLEQAAGLSAETLNWYTYIADALLSSFSLVSVQSVQAPPLGPTVIAQSNAATSTLIIP